jgi:hypothetical protein
VAGYWLHVAGPPSRFTLWQAGSWLFNNPITQ